MWISPRGHRFADPTVAMVDALLHDARLREDWCGDKLSKWSRLTLADYARCEDVRELVHALLAEAGYIEETYQK